MKSKLILLSGLFISTISRACDVCKAKQPKGFENITHGEGPEGDIDYIIMFSAIIIVGYTLIMSVKYLIKPKEEHKNHIKNLVLDKHNFMNLWKIKER